MFLLCFVKRTLERRGSHGQPGGEREFLFVFFSSLSEFGQTDRGTQFPNVGWLPSEEESGAF